MCTRFQVGGGKGEGGSIGAATAATRLAEKFAAQGRAVQTEGEVRPTDVVGVVAPGKDGRRCAFPMQWGFRLSGGGLVVNARVESAASKPSFRESWAWRRCAIPAVCYFEWEHRPGPRGRMIAGAKYAIRRPGDDLLWLCGLYRLEEGLPVFAVLTREAVASLAWLHDRMPLILPSGRIGEWIQPGGRPEELLESALTELEAELADGRE